MPCFESVALKYDGFESVVTDLKHGFRILEDIYSEATRHQRKWRSEELKIDVSCRMELA